MTRYFMTIAEAVQLVLQAGALGGSGEVMVLDMGTPVRIQTMAEQVIALSGKPIDIVYTGLRPGEKMHEVLSSEHEALTPTSHPLIGHVPVPPIDPSELFAHEQILDLRTSPDAAPLPTQPKLLVEESAATVADTPPSSIGHEAS